MEYNMMQDFRDRENELFCAAVMVSEADTFKDLSDDFILPDYLPDMKKIVWAKACPRLGNRFLGSGVLEYEGAVAYKVLYISDDNTIRCAAFLSEFKNRIVCEELAEECVDILHPVASMLNCRMQNPRKLNIRCQAGVTGAIWKRQSFLPELYGASSGEEKSIETRQICMDAIAVTNQRQDGLVFSEDITLDSSMPAVDQIICCNANLYADECRVVAGELLIRGVCEVEAVYSVAGEEKEGYVSLRRTLPFSQSLDANEIKDGCTCLVTVLPEGVTLNVREDEFGKRRMIELDINYGLDIEAIRPQKLYYCADCYSVKRECQTAIEKQKIWHLCSSGHISFSVNENYLLTDIEAGDMREAKVCMVEPMLLLKEERSAKGKAILEGVAKVSILGVYEDGRNGCIVLDVPLRYEGEGVLAEDEVKANIECRAMGVRCRVDDKKLYVDFEVVGSVTLLAYKEADVISVIRMMPDRVYEGEKGAIATLYYVQKGETIFDIAKKYKVSRASLMERNSLESENEIVGVALLIPQKKS